MATIDPVDIGWLVLLINAYGEQPQAAAGPDAVPRERADARQPAVAGRVTVNGKRRLATALWPVFAGQDPGERAAALELVLADANLSPRVDASGALAWTAPRRTPADALAAACAVALLEAVTAHGWSRLGTCDGCDCVDVYVDRAVRGRPRKYCSGTCLNRSKVRAFRSRQAGARP